MTEEDDTLSDARVLDDAFAALREESAERSRAVGASRGPSTRRSLLLASTSRRRRAVAVRFVVPLAAVLGVSTAWAAATGRLPGAMSAIHDVFFGSGPGPSASVPPIIGATAAPAPTIADAAAPTDPSRSDVPSAASTEPSASPMPSSAAAAKPIPANATAADPEEHRYRAAHEAHFVSRDWGRALAGWDAYLASHPTGRFAPEARYNRAIALIRLGRRDEARAALQPFADGAFGGYRQEEARQLLDAVE